MEGYRNIGLPVKDYDQLKAFCRKNNYKSFAEWVRDFLRQNNKAELTKDQTSSMDCTGLYLETSFSKEATYADA